MEPGVVGDGRVSRPTLERRLDASITHRATVVATPAGFGKTTLMAAWSEAHGAAWHSVEVPRDGDPVALAGALSRAMAARVDALGDARAPRPGGRDPDPATIAARLAERVARTLRRDLVLVVDDTHRLHGTPGATLLADFMRNAPTLLHLVVTTRDEAPFPLERLRENGALLEIGVADLVFTREETVDLLRSVDPRAATYADDILAATDGWPAAVRLAVEAVSRDGRRALRRADTSATPFADLAREVLRHETIEAQALLRSVVVVERFTFDLCDAIGLPGARPVLLDLANRGLFVQRDPADPHWFRLTTAAREFLEHELPLADDDRRRIQVAASRWLEATGHPDDAVRAAIGAGVPGPLRDVLQRQGEALATSGHAALVEAAVAALPPEAIVPEVDLLRGHAAQLRGRWRVALEAYGRAGLTETVLSPWLAWRAGLIYYLRGDLDEASAIFERSRLDSSSDAAIVCAWRATVHWLRAQPADTALWAARSLDIAASAGDPQALAAAHTAMALLAALEGDRRANEAHYDRALAAAARARDTLQLTRIRTNRGSRHLEEGEYDQALAELDAAIALADETGYVGFEAIALSNRAEVRLLRGQLDAARADLEAAIRAFERLSSTNATYPLRHLGELHRLRGDRRAAEASYERAIEIAESAGDHQALVPALAGLALVIVHDDPERATALAEGAVSLDEGLGHVAARLSAARIAAIRGDTAAAREHLGAARPVAEQRRDMAGLAEVTELEAMLTEEPAAATALALQARQRWADLGHPIGVARAEMLRAARLHPDEQQRVVAEIRLSMADIGCREVADAAGRWLSAATRTSTTVRVETLGGFRLVRGGVVVPRGEWRSRKARDLLKLLVAHRGRPVPRPRLAETLWPDDDPQRTADRLNVALATLRVILDPDRNHGTDHFVASEGGAVSVVLAHVSVDLEEFHADAANGLEHARRGHREEARSWLAQAESKYAGDPLEEDAYADWSVAVRDAARQVYIEVCRALAEIDAEDGRSDAAVRSLLRVLERDPYDEPAHLAMVDLLTAAGRHGDARRRYRRYADAMREIGVEAQPFPGG